MESAVHLRHDHAAVDVREQHRLRLVVIGGRHLRNQKTITIGDIQAFIQYSRQFSMPITQTANIANMIQLAVASAERVFELLDEAEEMPDSG